MNNKVVDTMQDLQQLTLVTIAYNSGAVLPAHIDSLLSTLDGAALPRWIIVDNDSGDGSRDMLATRYPNVEVLKSGTNVGFGAACNLGIQASDTPYVVVLNPDTQLSALALSQLLEELITRKAAIVGPALDPLPDSEVRPVDWLVGAVMLFDKAQMDPLGYFDEQFFLYEEDVDICKRANDAGMAVLQCRNISIPHVGGGSTASAPGIIYFLNYHKGRSYALYAQKHNSASSVMKSYVKKNRRRLLISLLTFGRSRYIRAKAKLDGVKSVLKQ